MEQQVIENLIGQYGWMAAIAFVFLIGRKTIESTIEAIKVFAGDDLNTDDVIIFDDNLLGLLELDFGKQYYLYMKWVAVMENLLLKVEIKLQFKMIN